MRRIVPIILSLIIISGCVSSQGQSTPAPTVPTATIPPAATTLQVTPTTTAPTTQQTTVPPSKPLASSVTLTGAGDSSGSFNVVAQGKIQINAQYDSALGEGKTGCTKTKSVYRVALVGSSIDATIIDGPVGLGKSVKTTFNIVTPGTYKIAVTGCYGWEAVISNA